MRGGMFQLGVAQSVWHKPRPKLGQGLVCCTMPDGSKPCFDTNYAGSGKCGVTWFDTSNAEHPACVPDPGNEYAHQGMAPPSCVGGTPPPPPPPVQISCPPPGQPDATELISGSCCTPEWFEEGPGGLCNRRRDCYKADGSLSNSETTQVSGALCQGECPPGEAMIAGQCSSGAIACPGGGGYNILEIARPPGDVEGTTIPQPTGLILQSGASYGEALANGIHIVSADDPRCTTPVTPVTPGEVECPEGQIRAWDGSDRCCTPQKYTTQPDGSCQASYECFDPPGYTSGPGLVTGGVDPSFCEAPSEEAALACPEDGLYDLYDAETGEHIASAVAEADLPAGAEIVAADDPRCGPADAISPDTGISPGVGPGPITPGAPVSIAPTPFAPPAAQPVQIRPQEGFPQPMQFPCPGGRTPYQTQSLRTRTQEQTSPADFRPEYRWTR